MNIKNLVKGLRILRVSVIIDIFTDFLLAIAAVVSLKGGISLVNSSGGIESANLFLIMLVGVFFIIVSSNLGLIVEVMEIIALGKMIDAHKKYKWALFLVLGKIILSIFTKTLYSYDILANILTVVLIVANILVFYYIITATVTLLESKGDKELADKGIKISAIYILVGGIQLIIHVIGMMIKVSELSLIISLVLYIVLLYYFVFLGRAAKSLEN